MKEVLEYTEEELRNLSVEELVKLSIEAAAGESLYNTRQLVEKTLINSLYGALANKYFPLANDKMAAAITGNGRYFIRKLANYIEEALQAIIPSEKAYIIYGDTDSVTVDTLVKTDQGDIKIEDLYEKLSGNIEERGSDNFIKHVSDNINAGSVSKELEYQEKQIKYVMKHKVKKRMFKITAGGESVTVTEDHSIMVLRDDNLTSVKPTEILKTDKIIRLK